MSSPAAAEAALVIRAKAGLMDQEPGDGAVGYDGVGDDAYAPYIYEPTDEDTVDAQPAHIVEESEAEIGESEQRKLRQFARLAAELKGQDDDRKIVECAEVVAQLLREGYQPIVWCRYIATSDYVAEELARRLPGLIQNQSLATSGRKTSRNPQSEIKNPKSEIRVISVTGALTDDERRLRVQELAAFPRRVLVATDCLSEGINLQDHFSAVVHYDLPWNPNRLEQREGRVDRFGQRAKQVKAVLIYGRDNPVDGAVLDVLLHKAQEIRNTLGVSVPVPRDSETVMEAVLKALFFRGADGVQLRLFEEPTVTDLHREWDRAAEREKENRTRFAQRAIKPEEVERELHETDSVLGDPGAVQRFVLNASQRLGASVQSSKNGAWMVAGLAQLPDLARAAVPDATDEWRVSFSTPAPEGSVYLGRNHPFVAALAQYLMEAALAQSGQAPASRCGVIKTRQVERRTILMLLRLRFLIQESASTSTSGQEPAQLAEEVLVCAFRGWPPDRIEWLGQDEALALLEGAHADANITQPERIEVLTDALAGWPVLQGAVETLIGERARKLQEAHRRVRAAARLARRGLKVRPHLPPDLLGVLVLLPIPAR